MPKFEIHNRRYIGSKTSLADWIMRSIPANFRNGVFFDAFAGTGVVSQAAASIFPNLVLNDLLYSNEVIYKAFFGSQPVNLKDLKRLTTTAIRLAKNQNFFGEYFGGNYFTPEDARMIGAYRIAIDKLFPDESQRIRHVALASLIYSADRSAITVGHYEAFLRNGKARPFIFDPITPKYVNAKIFRQDANLLARDIKSDVVYLDPPYNSRQYSRFYHVLETLTKWDNPALFGVALKPAPENASEYSKTAAPLALADLVSSLDSKFILISYNNTYESKSGSSRNKITLDEIEEIARAKGKTEILERSHKYFNSGNTKFANHREFLFAVEVSQ